MVGVVAPGRMRIPRAAYRLQLNEDFTLSDAAELMPYLSELGVSDLYASPYLKARPGSTHGYDVVDPGSLNPELGGEKEYGRLVEALGEYEMGQLLDIVPNHISETDRRHVDLAVHHAKERGRRPEGLRLHPRHRPSPGT